MALTARRARPGDWLAVEALNQASRRALPNLWPWEEYLGEDVFVIIEQKEAIVGALFAWPDESPVAWVRLANLRNGLDTDEWFDASLPPVITGLQRRGALSLAWMDFEEWAAPHLRARGFIPFTEVETLAKFDRNLPARDCADAHVRNARQQDLPAIAEVDRSAFSPHWRYGQATMSRRLSVSPIFIVGYAEGELRPPTAHLNRVAVDAHHQECGIGALLVRAALRRFWQGGADQVTLNTQADNGRARRLYRRLGFQYTGQYVTAWELPLAPYVPPWRSSPPSP